MAENNFIINKEYIKFQIPDNLKTTWVFERVVDLFYAAISSETASGAKIQQYYTDIEFFNTDFTKLSVEMKEAKLKDNGYGFLIDIFGSDNTSLNNLSSFLALIKALKGKTEGFKLILDTLGFSYSFTTWEEPDYKGEIFTALLKITISSEQGQLADSVITKLQEVARNYLAPLVTIEYATIEDLLDNEVHGFNNYLSAGYAGTTKYSEFEIVRSL